VELSDAVAAGVIPGNVADVDQGLVMGIEEEDKQASDED